MASPVQVAVLLGGQRREYAGRLVAEQFVGLPEDGAAGLRDGQDLPAPVGRVAFAGDEFRLLESVEERDDVAAVQAQARRYLLLRGRSELVEAAEDRVLLLVDAKPGDLLGAVLPYQRGQPERYSEPLIIRCDQSLACHYV